MYRLDFTIPTAEALLIASAIRYLDERYGDLDQPGQDFENAYAPRNFAPTNVHVTSSISQAKDGEEMRHEILAEVTFTSFDQMYGRNFDLHVKLTVDYRGQEVAHFEAEVLRHEFLELQLIGT